MVTSSLPGVPDSYYGCIFCRKNVCFHFGRREYFRHIFERKKVTHSCHIIQKYECKIIDMSIAKTENFNKPYIRGKNPDRSK